MTPSPACAALVQRFEKCWHPVLGKQGWFETYMPTSKDVPTIGWGSTGPDVRMGMIWSQEMCDDRFSKDLSAFGVGVDHDLDGHPTTQAQFDALVSFGYNVGLDAEAHSTLMALHLAGDHTGAKAEFARWNHQDGVVLPGLTARRSAEAALYGG